LPFTKNHGDSVAFSLVVGIVPGSFLSHEHLQHSPSSPFFFCSIAAVAYETCFLGQDWARHPSVHHRCHRCPFVWLPGFVCYLPSEPHDQRPPRVRPGYHCLHDSSCSSLTFYDVDERQQFPRQQDGGGSSPRLPYLLTWYSSCPSSFTPSRLFGRHRILLRCFWRR
jgi:hypothetical protein